MRIDRLELRNFKKFAAFDLDLHRQFTLLIGENGAGKTSVLDALAVALGVWLVEPPDSTLTNSRRGIYASEIRLESSQRGDRELFREAIGDVSVKATGQIVGRDNLVWERRIRHDKRKATNLGAKEALAVIAAAYERATREDSAASGNRILRCGSCMASPPREAKVGGRGKRSCSPVGSFLRLLERTHSDCGSRRLVPSRSNRGREPRWSISSGFEVVRQAVLRCVPEADRMWFDGDRGEIVLSIRVTLSLSAI